MITAQQLHKYSVSLFTQIQNTMTYEDLKKCLFEWRDSSKNAVSSIVAFQKIMQIIATQTPDLQDDLNRCIIKDYNSLEKEENSL